MKNLFLNYIVQVKETYLIFPIMCLIFYDQAILIETVCEDPILYEDKDFLLKGHIESCIHLRLGFISLQLVLIKEILYVFIQFLIFFFGNWSYLIKIILL